MSDIVERLRAWHTPGETITGDVQLYLDAADEIERLRAALRQIACDGPGCEFENLTGYDCIRGAKEGEAWCPRCIARQTLQKR